MDQAEYGLVALSSSCLMDCLVSRCLAADLVPFSGLDRFQDPPPAVVDIVSAFDTCN
jgi:hypothetical protein